MKYVALLRGINVGGNHRVPNAELQSVLEGLGFQDVLIYINSGNAIFTSTHEPSTSKVQAALEQRFGFTIPTLILSGKKIQAISAAIPLEWTNDAPKPDKSGQKSDVLYLFDSINTPDVIEKFGYKPELETMMYIDGAVLTSITRANQSRGSLQKLVANKKLYGQVTIRNINTAKKLAQLVQGHNR